MLSDLACVIGSADAEKNALLDELLVASQCDLLVAEMLAGSADYAELPPIDEDCPRGLIARELLSWAFRGTVPGRYRHVCQPACLYARADRQRVISTLDELRLDCRSPELAGYAEALAALVSPARQ